MRGGLEKVELAERMTEPLYCISFGCTPSSKAMIDSHCDQLPKSRERSRQRGLSYILSEQVQQRNRVWSSRNGYRCECRTSAVVLRARVARAHQRELEASRNEV